MVHYTGVIELKLCIYSALDLMLIAGSVAKWYSNVLVMRRSRVRSPSVTSVQHFFWCAVYMRFRLGNNSLVPTAPA